MRKLADYAFMLRDWKLAQSTYELLRGDFSNDKAWKYYAAANEMSVISTLLLPQVISSKVRSETIDQMLETASYSYITRCGALYGALRCLALGLELLRIRGSLAADDAARWGMRLLEAKVTGPIGDALFKERIAICYASRKGAGSGAWGTRTRKSALWNILAADTWLTLGKHVQAERRLVESRRLYMMLPDKGNLTRFAAANDFMAALEQELQISSTSNENEDRLEAPQDEMWATMDEDSEPLGIQTYRKSLIGTVAPPFASLRTAPLNSMQTPEKSVTRDDDFE